jgi:hypothetical protein
VEAEEMSKYAPLLDQEGRIKRWPKKATEKQFVLEYLKSKFSSGRRYTEKEINSIIIEWHAFADYALLRRELYDRYLINRTNDGREYWVGE